MDNVINIESMIERLNKLAVTSECEAYTSSLRKDGEELRFTDTSVGVREDAEISDIISSIETDVAYENEITGETMKADLVTLHSLIAKRKLFTKKGRV